jgi:hypothetical protein
MKVVDDKNIFERHVDVAYQSNTVSGIDRKVISQLSSTEDCTAFQLQVCTLTATALNVAAILHLVLCDKASTFDMQHAVTAPEASFFHTPK